MLSGATIIIEETAGAEGKTYRANPWSVQGASRWTAGHAAVDGSAPCTEIPRNQSYQIPNKNSSLSPL
jgi:hypothetical protein